jgi:hypothetical protein
LTRETQALHVQESTRAFRETALRTRLAAFKSAAAPLLRTMDRLSDSTLIKLQAGSGLAFGSFLTLHLANALFAHKGAWMCVLLFKFSC